MHGSNRPEKIRARYRDATRFRAITVRMPNLPGLGLISYYRIDPARGAARGKLAAPFCIGEVLDPEAPEESKHAYRTKGSAWILQVVNCLRSFAHPSGPGGSLHFCSFASCQCAVLGKFMGRAPAATAAAIQSLCAAAVQSLCAAAVQSLWWLRG